MKKLLFTFSVGFLISLSADAYISEETEYICPDPVLKYQKLEGWGSSLCWWAAQVGKWDDEKIDAIVDALTSPDQLNMNIFRYNIGGGDDPSHADGHMVKGKGKRAEMEGFKSSKDADYNWNADAAQRKILLKIKDRRKDAVFEAFSNSAPYWMTYSGCSAGNDNPLEDNLKPEYYELFCRYLVDVCQYYKEHCGIEFKTLEPFNESFSNYWYNLGSQEGCHFEPETQMTIIRILYPMLQESGLPTVISASDETNLNQFLTVQKSYREAGDIWEKIGQLNTHTYGGNNEERVQVRELVAEAGKPFWQSETGPSGNGRGLESNLALTQKMFDDLRIMRPQAWLDWQIMEEHNDEWCVMRGNFQAQEYKLIKNFYVRMQITRFFKQGYTFIETGNRQALAAVSSSGKEAVFAVLNTSGSPKRVNVSLGKFDEKLKKVTSWRTSATEDCQQVEDFTLDGSSINYVMPAQSLTTFVVNFR